MLHGRICRAVAFLPDTNNHSTCNAWQGRTQGGKTTCVNVSPSRTNLYKIAFQWDSKASLTKTKSPIVQNAFHCAGLRLSWPPQPIPAPQKTQKTLRPPPTDKKLTFPCKGMRSTGGKAAINQTHRRLDSEKIQLFNCVGVKWAD